MAKASTRQKRNALQVVPNPTEVKPVPTLADAATEIDEMIVLARTNGPARAARLAGESVSSLVWRALLTLDRADPCPVLSQAIDKPVADIFGLRAHGVPGSSVNPDLRQAEAEMDASKVLCKAILTLAPLQGSKGLTPDQLGSLRADAKRLRELDAILAPGRAVRARWGSK
jgi:hypothetical protein